MYQQKKVSSITKCRHSYKATKFEATTMNLELLKIEVWNDQKYLLVFYYSKMFESCRRYLEYLKREGYSRFEFYDIFTNRFFENFLALYLTPLTPLVCIFVRSIDWRKNSFTQQRGHQELRRRRIFKTLRIKFCSLINITSKPIFLNTIL